ncbi:hypothetical protein [Methanocaldococcus sp.]
MKKETKIKILVLMNAILVALTLFALITGRVVVYLNWNRMVN